MQINKLIKSQIIIIYLFLQLNNNKFVINLFILLFIKIINNHIIFDFIIYIQPLMFLQIF